ncbi:methyltransferase domain-containing protein [Candidatus Lokiarchaeum ossiferum]|uniref:methyltransferase domain-containing protein n=1 Tax=Candidatus Lokiarchaeum ossiferum TaxID=2951803 RepID=UPI00352EFBBE
MIKNKLITYFLHSNRRKHLDRLQKKYSDSYFGKVLDIGGRNRGNFIKPRYKTTEWVYIDIQEKYQPDLVQDVSKMIDINDNSFDVVNTIELFEHVNEIDKGFLECRRVLKPQGLFILSMPFLSPIHADPYDFQRWTKFKIEKTLLDLNFKIEKIEVMGYFFSTLSEILKDLIRSLPVIIRHFGYLFFPFFDFLILFDKLRLVKNHKKLGNYHGGYFIIAKKI